MEPFLSARTCAKTRASWSVAYDDSAGVTAAFNRNVLVRLNKNLAPTSISRPSNTAHPRIEAESRIEMHLVCRRAHTVHLGGQEIKLAAR